MTSIFLFAFFFLATLTVTGFKKAHFLKDFTTTIKGKVVEVTSTDEGVFLIVEYFIEKNKDESSSQDLETEAEIEKQRAIYKHRFSLKKLPEKKLQFVVMKFVDSSFYLLGKKENETLVQVAAYSNVKYFKWLYLSGSLIAAYFLFV
jgi:hypothetical protein